MILKSPSIERQSQLVNTTDTSASNTISQLLMFNSVKQTQSLVADSSSTVSHKHYYETPIPAMKTHAATCNRNLIDTFFNLDIRMCFL